MMCISLEESPERGGMFEVFRICVNGVMQKIAIELRVMAERHYS
jgi:hypothetical protein